jgi:hypothetical protein
MSLPPNTEIREVLGILRYKVTPILKRGKCILIFNIGYSSVAGLQIKRAKESAMLGPIIPLPASALASVTSDPSCYDLSNRLSINRDETVLTFYNRYIIAGRPPRSELSLSSRLHGLSVRDTLITHEFKI